MVVDDANPSTLYSLVDGGGNWTSVAKLDLPPHSHAGALADFNRDGRLDVATISGSTHTVQVCFGDGSGGFDDCVLVPHELDQPTDVVAFDIDSDGWSDLVAIGYEGRISAIHVVPIADK